MRYPFCIRASPRVGSPLALNASRTDHRHLPDLVHAVLVLIAAGQQRSVRGKRPGRRCDSVLKQHALGGDAINIRTGGPGVSIRGQMIGAQRVHHDDQYIGRIRAAAGNLLTALASCSQCPPWIPANASTPPRQPGARFALQIAAWRSSCFATQRLKATPTPAASNRQLRWDRRAVTVSQSYRVSAVNKAMAACSRRSFGTSRPTAQRASVKTQKRMRSTMGEIQMIGSETCRVGPHRAQLILWKSNRPTPSTRPAMIANQMARSRKDPRPGGDPALGDGTSVVVSVRDTQPSLRLIGGGTIGNGRRELR